MLREAEVREERPAVRGEDDVLGLHVAVDDPALVRGSERARHLEAESHRLLDPERAPLESLPERPARHEGHDEPGALVPEAGVEEADESVLLAERAEEAPLPVEAVEGGGVRPDEELEGGLAAPGRAHPEDHAHAAAAELAQDLVAPDPHAASMALARARRNRWLSGRASSAPRRAARA